MVSVLGLLRVWVRARPAKGLQQFCLRGEREEQIGLQVWDRFQVPLWVAGGIGFGFRFGIGFGFGFGSVRIWGRGRFLPTIDK